MNFSLRYATKDDAALIADISHQTFYDTFAADNNEEDMQKFLTQQFTKGKLMLEVGSPQNIFLLAYVDDAVAGYVKLRDDNKPAELNEFNAMEIARIYVLKEFLGKKLGAKLMGTSLSIAEEKNKDVVWLGVWEKNERAMQFYTRFGFEKFGECDFLLGNDLQQDWLMKKNL